MKNIIVIISLLMPTMLVASDKYTENMQANITMLYKAGSIEELQQVANRFDRIGGVEKGEWLPQYYGSLAHIWMATREEDTAQKDNWLDLAQERLDKAVALENNNAEIVTLQGFIYMMRLTVDPATRGATMSPKAFAEFTKAVQLDKANPRALFFKGQMEFGTAQFFKMDTTPACTTMANSIELFDNFTPETVIHPGWGKSFAEKTVANCK